MNAENGALVQLKAYIGQSSAVPGDRIPAERVLCKELGISRGELRRAIAVLEAEGRVWRHVGRGTFVSDGMGMVEEPSVSEIAKKTTLRDVMKARLVLEPMLAGLAAEDANLEQMEAMSANIQQSRKAETWREYEASDNRFHRLLAQATQNVPLLAMFDQLNSLRRTVVWGRLRQRAGHPPVDHHSFTEHEAIVDAIRDRNAAKARAEMHAHLTSVSNRLFEA
ncbi:FCD domain-containing protein [Roseibium sp.]|uniref:FadR/GntR family transcriptional regulator n=1 Tax=Roseibium sp. TaxID=1936156 RepID=UPI0032646B44